MEKIWLHGDLKEILFSQLLGRIWRNNRSGSLKIRRGGEETHLDFHEGDLAVTIGSLDAQPFLEALTEELILTPTDARTIRNQMKKTRGSLFASLMDCGFLPPEDIWKHLDLFTRTRIHRMFEWSQGEYFFDSEHLPEECKILYRISSPELILQGMRFPSSSERIDGLLPQENQKIHINPEVPADSIPLSRAEEYLLRIIRGQKTLEEILRVSILGEKESRRRLSALMVLGIIGLSQSGNSGTGNQAISPVDLQKIMERFNQKCSAIYKYISKEIGPVASSILEKGIEDTHLHETSLFRKIHLKQDGRIESSDILKASVSLSGETTKREFLGGLNEILVAEILAVKKTLGNEHEAILVETLKRIE